MSALCTFLKKMFILVSHVYSYSIVIIKSDVQLEKFILYTSIFRKNCDLGIIYKVKKQGKGIPKCRILLPRMTVL